MIKRHTILFTFFICICSIGLSQSERKKFDTPLYTRASNLCYTNPDSSLILIDSLNKYSLDDYDTINYVMVKVVEANAWKIKSRFSKVDSILKLAEIRTKKSGIKSEGYNTFLLFKAISITDEKEEETIEEIKQEEE